MRPLLKWAGGKSRLVPQILGLFPKKFSRYVEPFIGGGAVFLSLEKETSYLIADSNSDLIGLYEVVKSAPEKLMKALDRMPAKYSEKYYYELRSQDPVSDIQRAARLVFLNKTGFNGLYRENARGEFNVSFGKRVKCPELYDRENLLAVSRHLQKADIVCEDFLEVLNRCGKGDLVYCDPPYVPVSQTACFESYTRDRFGADRHRELSSAASDAVKRGATVLISNSTAAIHFYPGWTIETVQASRAINCHGDKRGSVDEIIAVLSPRIDLRSPRKNSIQRVTQSR
ncbi:DNA adenine methylase [bacterium]|nr:DNA adenine methylase [bacterium]